MVDRDTLGLSGAPDISDTILAKISEADAFVADVTLINSENKEGRLTPNPNVLVELGYALAKLGNEAIVLVFNTHFGEVEQLPFDLRPLRLLTYHAAPDDQDRATARNELTRTFKSAIESIASVVRNDPVHSIIYPRTLNIAGQANGLLSDLIKAAGKPYDSENITEQELADVCRLIDPNGQAPLVLELGPQLGSRYATWIELLAYYRERSRKFASEVMVFSPLLKPRHIALVATVEQCSYFAMLEHLRASRTSNNTIEWMSNLLWKYLLATRQLKEYAHKVLARRAAEL